MTTLEKINLPIKQVDDGERIYLPQELCESGKAGERTKAMYALRRYYEEKNGKEWNVTAYQESAVATEALLEDMIVNYVWKGTAVKRIIDKPNYDGTRTVTVYYSLPTKTTRARYIVKE